MTSRVAYSHRSRKNSLQSPFFCIYLEILKKHGLWWGVIGKSPSVQPLNMNEFVPCKRDHDKNFGDFIIQPRIFRGYVSFRGCQRFPAQQVFENEWWIIVSRIELRTAPILWMLWLLWRLWSVTLESFKCDIVIPHRGEQPKLYCHTVSTRNCWTCWTLSKWIHKGQSTYPPPPPKKRRPFLRAN